MAGAATTADGVRMDGVRVQRGQRIVLNGLSFAVAPGEVVGLLGPNGAGKTTTLAVLATLCRPAAGRAWVGGFATDREAASIRRILGYVPQSLAVYPTLTARENLQCFAGLGGNSLSIDAVLRAVGLADRADDVVATYSGGMQRRLNLACGVLHRPRVLLLDEPTVGVDPQSRARIFATVREQAQAGAAVLYSTHYMEEAEQLCDRVVLIDAGRVLASGTPAELIARHGSGVRVAITTREPLPAGWLTPVPRARAQPAPADRGVGVTVAIDTIAEAPHVLEAVRAAGGDVLELRVVSPSLQDVFLDLTGRGLRDG